MKTKLKLLVIMAFTFGMILQLRSQGYIVPNGVSYIGLTGFGYEIHVISNPTTLGYTGFDLKPQNGGFLFAAFLDESVRVFFVSSLDPISSQAIQASSYTELPNPSGYVFDDGIPFYVGLYTGNFPVNGTYENPLFGWAELVNNNGVIELLDSALEYGGGGIIAGTQTIIPIPEPGTMSLLLVGVGLLGLHRCRNSAR